jgi:cobalt transporter subunit CbtB
MTDLQRPAAADRAVACAHTRWAGIRSLIAAALLGVAVLYLVGFAGSRTIHEAAHDARHTLNFPCH